LKSVAKSFELKCEFYEKEILRIEKTITEKDREFALLEMQFSKANYDNDQLNKTNENLIYDNKFMMEEIGSLKKILKKIDDWKLKIFHIMRDEIIEKEVLRNIVSDFPNYNEIKENFKFLNKNINEISNINLNYSGNLGKEYMLSSFNNHNNNPNFNNNRDRGGKLNFEEKYFNCGSNRNNININNNNRPSNINNRPERDFNSIERNFIDNINNVNNNDNYEEKFEQEKSPQRVYLEEKVIFNYNYNFNFNFNL